MDLSDQERLESVRQALVALNCPEEKSEFMASQLDKRAWVLVEERQMTYTEAMRSLLGLMGQGWAAPN